MAQHTELFLSTKHYTRQDYAALRSYCLNLPFEKIAQLYYTENSPQISYGLEKYLLEMRDDLIERAILNNPLLAHSLQHARQGGKMTDAALRILRNAAEIPAPIPQPEQPLTLWFKPKTISALQQENIQTIAELLALIKQRGSGWWRAIPRIGRLRAQVLARWLHTHSATLGTLVIENNLPSPAPLNRIVLGPGHPGHLAPLGRFTTSGEFDGSCGLNRAHQFCFIQAKNDLDALEFYLSRYNDQPHTLRAYRKELERLLLWAIVVRGKPLSSLLVDDCEAYKRFLVTPCPAFVGPKAARFSQRWKPFSEKAMSAKSQRHALIILRAAFDYLAGVRYLSGNPWIAVKYPSVRKEINPVQIHKALPSLLWNKLLAKLEERTHATSVMAAQYRSALAAILLMGDSGLRREEAATVRRGDLIKSAFGEHVWECRVLGKGNKERSVPVSLRTVDALHTHWEDRQLDWHNAGNDMPLLAPLIQRHPRAQERRTLLSAGYTPDTLAQLVKSTLRQLLNEPETDFTEEERQHLFNLTVHHLRHTFGTLSVANGMPVDVTQAILGHASLGTTAIYVQAKKQRIMEQAGQFFSAATKTECQD